jgi:hypothetical protein
MNQAEGSKQQNSREVDVALRYLDLARGELLERIRFANQLVPAYLGVVSAVAGWLYSANKEDPHRIFMPVAMMAAFLGFAAIWLLHDNELMVGLLAEYQVQTLGPVLREAAPRVRLWEASEGLKSSLAGNSPAAKSALRYFWAVVQEQKVMSVQSFLLIVPGIAFLVMRFFVAVGGQTGKMPMTAGSWAAVGCIVLLELGSALACKRMMYRRKDINRLMPDLPQKSAAPAFLRDDD